MKQKKYISTVGMTNKTFNQYFILLFIKQNA